MKKICTRMFGFTNEEIDAAECWLTYEGAGKLHVCTAALDQWLASNRKPKLISVAALQRFDQQRNHLPLLDPVFVRLWPRVRRVLDPYWSRSYADANIEACRVSWKDFERALKALIMVRGRPGKPRGLR